MKQSKTTLKELTAAYRAVLRHGILCNAIALGLMVATPATATGFSWMHPADIDSYTQIDKGINYSFVGTEEQEVSANIFTGTAMRNVVKGDVVLTLDGVKQVGTADLNSVYGNAFFTEDRIESLDGMSAPEDPTLRQYVDGNVSVVVQKGSIIDRNIIGDQFYTKLSYDMTEDMGLSGKTTVSVFNSTVKGDVRGANIGNSDASDKDPELAHIKVNDIELNINNSLVEDEVVAVGAYLSAGDVTINVRGNSIIGYDAANTTNTAKEENGSDADGWIIAGAQRPGGTVGNTEINLNTLGTAGKIRIASDVQAGSRQNSNAAKESSPDSVTGNAKVNMFGGGNIEIGRDVRAYHVKGNTTLNLKNITADVAGTVKEFKTINIDALSELHAGTLEMTADDVLKIVITDPDTYGKVFVDTLDVHGATLEMTFKGEGTYNLIASNTENTDITLASDFFTFAENKVYDVTSNDKGTFVVKAKSAEDIAGDTGMSGEAASVVSNVAKSGSVKLQNLSVKMQEKLAEAGDDPVAKAAANAAVEHATKAIHPETESVAQSVASSVQNTVVSLVSSRMAAPRVGRNGGDAKLTAGGVWAQGLFNKSKQNNAFSGSTRGIALGLDGTLNKHWTIGAGYSHASSDIDGSARNTEVDSNTVFVYGQYKPSQWYLNAVANYTSSDYSEKGTVIDDTPIFGDYSVNSFGGSLATGYDFRSGITPELGLRYMHVSSDDYANSYDVKTHMDDTDYLTGIFGAKYTFKVVANRHTMFMPQLNAGVKYDLLSDKNLATVTMPGVNAYTLEGERLNRIGGEFGIGLGVKYGNLEISANYDVDVREDYTSQTGLLKFRTNF
jgi:outer membrane autotransporter protein